MTLLGHGIDLILMAKVEAHLASPHPDWLESVFTENERTQADPDPNRVAFLSGRYAAKEAIAKALGTGFSDEVTWQDVEVLRNATGSVEVQLSGGALTVAERLGITAWIVSISHGGDYAVASAIAFGT